MKIKCDVCGMAEASVFCSADEAALCDGCDRHVHHANKLASKHMRHSLLHPSSKQSPLCDVCQSFSNFSPLVEDQDLESHISSFSQEDLAFWVPQVSTQLPQQDPAYHPQIKGGLLNGSKESKEVNNRKDNRKWIIEDAFTVPEMSHKAFKKSRHFP
ncbi:hypothetical protein GH714_030369 [Hevea brasiliensis]|uniref:B box-type domain-containing protein n=1 Tax=Hevea brasiliensis TaxID=3981 RepID=A0A6A6LP67_HEVBR|nr:hypothetical protein GH714_030369 [Hevea brasiliensis]